MHCHLAPNSTGGCFHIFLYAALVQADFDDRRGYIVHVSNKPASPSDCNSVPCQIYRIVSVDFAGKLPSKMEMVTMESWT